MPFDGIRDFTHISRVSVGSTLFVVNANRPWKTFEEFVADAKRRPGQISAASSGIGTISHLTISKLMKTAGIEVSHVPYRGLAPGLNDLLAGNVAGRHQVINACLRLGAPKRQTESECDA